jgi:hypothetical protein
MRSILSKLNDRKKERRRDSYISIKKKKNYEKHLSALFKYAFVFLPLFNLLIATDMQEQK